MKKIFKFFISLTFIFVFQNSISKELICTFEEVYPTGDIQQGFFLLKEKNIRYEYINPNLYTIFFDNKDLIIVQNKDRNLKNYEYRFHSLFKSIYQLTRNYPNNPTNMIIHGYSINLEKSKSHDFYKRISIKSDEINLSIFLNDCSYKNINDNYFKLSPVKEYIFD